jgi:hypothetical protein
MLTSLERNGSHQRGAASKGSGVQKGRRKGMALLLLLLVVSITLLVASMIPTTAYFSDTEGAGGAISVGKWGCPPHIDRICPDWGIRGACSWAVFIKGKNFGMVESARLVGDTGIMQAKKVWRINGSLIYAVFDLREAEKGWYDVCVGMDNGEATLEDGFQVIGWCRCVPTGSREYPAGEDRLNLEKRADEEEKGHMTITVSGQMPEDIESVCVVGPGFMEEGYILDRKPGELALGFDGGDSLPAECDLILTTDEGWNLLLERAINDGDLLPSTGVLSLYPDRAPAGAVVDLHIECKGLHEGTAFKLNNEECEVEPAGTRWTRGDGLDEVICTFDLGGALHGVYDLEVTDPLGTAGVLRECFTVYAEQGDEKENPGEDTETEEPDGLPALEDPSKGEEGSGFSITPSSGRSGGVVDVVIRGGSLPDMMEVRLRGRKVEVWAARFQVQSGNTLQCRFNLYTVPAGEYVLEILDRQGNLLYIAGVFVVE